MSALRSAGVAVVAGCAAAGAASPAAHLPPPSGYHGVIVWPAGGPGGPTRVSFQTVWRADGAARAFPRADAGGGWTAAGRLDGDSLEWSLTRLEGDAGVTLRFVGAADAAGRVRGCGLVRGLSRAGSPASAFVLAPLGAPWPDSMEAPVARCRARAGSAASEPTA